jgi:hypothetical protein
MMLVMSLAPILSPMRTSKVRSLRSQVGIGKGAVLDFGNRALFNSWCESDVSTRVQRIPESWKTLLKVRSLRPKVAGLQVEESRMWRPKVSFSRLELDVDFEIGQRCQSEKVALGDWYKRKRIRQAYFRQSEVPTRPSVRRIHRFCLWAKVSKLRQSLLV